MPCLINLMLTLYSGTRPRGREKCPIDCKKIMSTTLPNVLSMPCDVTMVTSLPVSLSLVGLRVATLGLEVAGLGLLLALGPLFQHYLFSIESYSFSHNLYLSIIRSYCFRFHIKHFNITISTRKKMIFSLIFMWGEFCRNINFSCENINSQHFILTI